MHNNTRAGSYWHTGYSSIVSFRPVTSCTWQSTQPKWPPANLLIINIKISSITKICKCFHSSGAWYQKEWHLVQRWAFSLFSISKPPLLLRPLVPPSLHPPVLLSKWKHILRGDKLRFPRWGELILMIFIMPVMSLIILLLLTPLIINLLFLIISIMNIIIITI